MSTIARFLPQTPNGFSTQIASASVSSSALSISLDSISGLPTEGVGQLFKKDANGDLVAGSVEFCHWTNATGGTITFSDTGDRGITGSDSGAQAYVADDYFEVWVSSYYVGGYGGLIEHNANGTHASGMTLPSSVVTLTGTQTLTNKRNTPRVVTATNYTTDTGTSLNCDTTDRFIVTAQAGALKFNNPTGTPTDGQTLWIAVTGTAARALTYDTQFIASTTALPTTTVTTARLDMLFVWNAATSKWTIVAVS
jgi:hypothetical protein